MFIRNMKIKSSEKIYHESRPIHCHNCPRQFKNFHSLMQHRWAKHCKGRKRKHFYKSRPLNSKNDKFSLAMDKLARLLESIYIYREHSCSNYFNMTQFYIQIWWNNGEMVKSNKQTDLQPFLNLSAIVLSYCSI